VPRLAPRGSPRAGTRGAVSSFAPRARAGGNRSGAPPRATPRRAAHAEQPSPAAHAQRPASGRTRTGPVRKEPPNVGATTYISDGYGYYEGECTSFAAWAVRNDGLADSSSPNFLGNANSWHAAVTESTPHVGDVAQWDANHNGAGSTGHVAYVSAVYTNGTIQVEEYNWLSAANNYTGHRYNTRQITASTPSRYLKF